MPRFFVETLGGRLVKVKSSEVESTIAKYKEANFVDINTLDRESFPAIVVLLTGAFVGFKEEEIGLDATPHKGEVWEHLSGNNMSRSARLLLKEKGVELNASLEEQVKAYDEYKKKAGEPRKTRIVNTKVVRKIEYFGDDPQRNGFITMWSGRLGEVNKALLIKYG